MAKDDQFEFTAEDRESWENAPEGERLVVDLDGYEGPLDLLLDLARNQKVDITKISILALAEQYLEFIIEAKQNNIDIAADYLVMAAWLAFLKSRLLLPVEEVEEDEPTGPEMAAALQFQLERLEAMREAGKKILTLPRLGVDTFPRGAPEGVTVIRKSTLDVSLYDLLRAYGEQKRRTTGGTLRISPSDLYTVDEAISRLSQILVGFRDWRSLSEFLPPGLQPGIGSRSATASVFAASLELAKSGRAHIRQDTAFGPIYLRNRAGGGAGGRGPVGGGKGGSGSAPESGGETHSDAGTRGGTGTGGSAGAAAGG